MEFLESVCVVLFPIIIFALAGGLVWGICEIIWIFQKRNQKKKEAKHPEFYAMIAELDALSSASVHYHNDCIAPLKREVNQLRKMDYDPDFVKVQKEILIEKLCAEIYEKENHRKEFYEKPIAELRERIHAYNDIHHLEKGWERG